MRVNVRAYGFFLPEEIIWSGNDYAWQGTILDIKKR